jgi:hypothetical protein
MLHDHKSSTLKIEAACSSETYLQVYKAQQPRKPQSEIIGMQQDCHFYVLLILILFYFLYAFLLGYLRACISKDILGWYEAYTSTRVCFKRLSLFQQVM